jgi:short-subunit dehydrogenase
MAQFAQDVLVEQGQVDILVNNAGITLTPTVFEDISDEQFKKVIDVNMWGVYYGMREFLPFLRTRPEAVVVNIASLAGLVGLYGYSPYAMSKFAIRGLTESLQSELVGSNVSILIVYPGGVKTNLIKNAPDLSNSEQRENAHPEFTRSAGVTPEKAAGKILSAVKKNKRLLIIGTDAKIVNSIRGMFPNSFPTILQSAFSRVTFK